MGPGASGIFADPVSTADAELTERFLPATSSHKSSPSDDVIAGYANDVAAFGRTDHSPLDSGKTTDCSPARSVTRQPRGGKTSA